MEGEVKGGRGGQPHCSTDSCYGPDRQTDCWILINRHSMSIIYLTLPKDTMGIIFRTFRNLHRSIVFIIHMHDFGLDYLSVCMQ